MLATLSLICPAEPKTLATETKTLATEAKTLAAKPKFA
ncbi:hypothetical protein ENHYDAX1_220068 [Enhydrobacter sp. AX1]|nr:hypothetical protein ENHYDAX1_220068 [Enhydrobacter sp. AX1]